jgi:hypothetical protein
MINEKNIVYILFHYIENNTWIDKNNKKYYNKLDIDKELNNILYPELKNINKNYKLFQFFLLIILFFIILFLLYYLITINKKKINKEKL